MEHPETLRDVHTVGDARKLIDGMRGDWALAGYEAAFVTLRPQPWPLRVLAAMGCTEKRDEAAIPALREHVCRGCRHALRTPEGRHQLLRHVDYEYVETGKSEGISTLKIEEREEALATACCARLTVSPVAPMEDHQEGRGEAPLVFAPATQCPFSAREPAGK